MLFFRGNAANDYPDIACRRSTNLTRHDPALLYDLWQDPGEMNPLNVDDNFHVYIKLLEVQHVLYVKL